MGPDGQGTRTRRRPLPAVERRGLVLDAATRVFTARGVHAVGMDELIAETGLAKMSVYRIFPTKDALVGAYLERLADTILGLIDADIAAYADDPARVLHRTLDAIEADLRRPDFRGCPFGNAAAEFSDPGHPARRWSRDYRRALLGRLQTAAAPLGPAGTELAARLAVLVDGCYLSAANLGPDGPAAAGLALARELVDAAC